MDFYGLIVTEKQAAAHAKGSVHVCAFVWDPDGHQSSGAHPGY